MYYFYSWPLPLAPACGDLRFVFMIFDINVHEPLSLMTEEHKSMFPFCSYVLMSQRIHPGGFTQAQHAYFCAYLCFLCDK